MITIIFKYILVQHLLWTLIEDCLQQCKLLSKMLALLLPVRVSRNLLERNMHEQWRILHGSRLKREPLKNSPQSSARAKLMLRYS